MSSMPMTELRENLSEVLDEVVATGQTYTVTRHGRPVAILINADEYESLIETLNILSDPETVAAIEEARSERGDGGSGDAADA